MAPMNPTLAKLKSNLESADDAMRRNPNGGTPNRSWVGEQLMHVRVLEEAGFVSGEWDGLFVGLLDDLLVQKRHVDRYYDLMQQLAKAEPLDRERLKHAVSEAMNGMSKHHQACAEFIAKFGDRLALKAES